MSKFGASVRAFADQSFEKLRAQSLAEGAPFTDPEFPPCNQSLYVSGDGPDIGWLRASEISEKPVLFAEGATRFDINQGEIGDCWLMAAIANVTVHQHYFSKVVPEDQSFSENYAGIFHFRFWQFGEWVDVVVDDYLPTRYGKLIYLKSDNPNEFWTALMEKAYAKLHGSYEALEGGQSIDAMIDFTGGVGESYKLKEAPEDLFGIMLKACNRASMMSCSIDSGEGGGESRTETGLVRGHAYSLTKVVLAQLDSGEKFPLVRVRNPWGNEVEWNGPWSDRSREWVNIPEKERKRLGLTFDNDGEFYMSYKDFLQQFDSLEICNVPSDGIVDEEEFGRITWHESKVNGAWVAGSTAGGCANNIVSFATNPQFKIVLQDSDEDDDDLCTAIVSLIQKGTRGSQCTRGRNSCLVIGFSVHRLEDPKVELPLTAKYFRYHAPCAKSGPFINLRQVSARFKLPPGNYVIVPSTFRANAEGEFLLRVFAEKMAPIEAV